MGAGHDHGGPPPQGDGTAAAAYRTRLRIALGITLSVLVLQVIGGILADSLALLADAGHMATDALGLGMALVAIHFANRPATGRRTFGLARAEILAALANCLLLLGVGGYILYEAVDRFVTPAETKGGLAIVFAAVGLVANAVSLSLLMRGQKDSLNVRGAFLEVLADTLGSVAVLVSATVILTTGWQAADPIASLVIGLMIVPRTVKLAREALDVLLESAPKDVEVDEV
ncbi:cation transporter, partial [Streptomyces daliensis]|nr:cation transporter [Streptomyces daliensis]